MQFILFFLLLFNQINVRSFFFFFMANPCVCFSVLIGKVFSVRMQKEKKKKPAGLQLVMLL